MILYKEWEGQGWRSCRYLSIGRFCGVGLACEPCGECAVPRSSSASAGRAAGRAACGGGRAELRARAGGVCVGGGGEGQGDAAEEIAG